jgi:GT2 family glycosyltransferase
MVERKEKIGVGIITCNRPDYLIGLLNSLVQCEDIIDELVIINDGNPVKDFKSPLKNYNWLDNPENIGVGKSKNKAMQHLLDKECDFIFIIEDDMIILDPTIFTKYIEAYKLSGIHHFNYGPGSPFNRKQDIYIIDIYSSKTRNLIQKWYWIIKQ